MKKDMVDGGALEETLGQLATLRHPEDLGQRSRGHKVLESLDRPGR